MDSFFIAFNAILPVTIVVFFGYYFKHKKYLDHKSILQMNKLCFLFFLPALTFKNIAYTDIKKIMDIKLILFVMIAIVSVILISAFIVPFFEKDRKKQGSVIQGIYRSNFVILGIPIVAHIASDEAVAIASILVMVVIPIYNILAVFLLSFYGEKKSIGLKKVLLNIITNPLIIASFSGIIFSLYKITLPSFLEKALFDISKLGAVLPMFMLGARLNFSSVSNNMKDIGIVLLSKLILVPMIIITLAKYIGFDKNVIVCLVSLYCGPISTTSAIMAEEMGCDGQLSTQLVVFSTAISSITMFIWVFLLSYINII